MLSGGQWLSGRMFDLRLKCCWFEPHQGNCVVPLSKTLYPLLATDSSKKCFDLAENLLTGHFNIYGTRTCNPHVLDTWLLNEASLSNIKKTCLS